jgi:hypothetical protein
MAERPVRHTVPDQRAGLLETCGWLGLLSQVPFLLLILLSSGPPNIHDPSALFFLAIIIIGWPVFAVVVPCAIFVFVRLASLRLKGVVVPSRQLALAGFYVLEGFLVAVGLARLAR